jgi:hypothetical protein
MSPPKGLSRTFENARAEVGWERGPASVLPSFDQEPIFTNITEEADKLSNQNEIIKEELDGKGVSSERSEIKKPFVEPAISVPVDVLEATTFFQTATSGVTN